MCAPRMYLGSILLLMLCPPMSQTWRLTADSPRNTTRFSKKSQPIVCVEHQSKDYKHRVKVHVAWRRHGRHSEEAGFGKAGRGSASGTSFRYNEILRASEDSE